MLNIYSLNYIFALFTFASLGDHSGFVTTSQVFIES
jgi:hypothetical protein